MTQPFNRCSHTPCCMWQFFFFLLTASLLSACSRFAPMPPQRDLLAEQSLDQLQRTNRDLTQFKCVAKIVLQKPNRPVKSFRSAMAGRLTEHLRIDLFAPFGGSAGTFSSNGKHLFLVTHPSREYYKKRFGSGSLHRFVELDVSVSDLLELMVGRIPIHDDCTAQFTRGEGDHPSDLTLVDRWGNVRQKIFFDSTTQPVRAQWLDKNKKPTLSLAFKGNQQIGGFGLPKRIDLSDASGYRVTIFLERYEANAQMDESLFALDPPKP